MADTRRNSRSGGRPRRSPVEALLSEDPGAEEAPDIASAHESADVDLEQLEEVAREITQRAVRRRNARAAAEDAPSSEAPGNEVEPAGEPADLEALTDARMHTDVSTEADLPPVHDLALGVVAVALDAGWTAGDRAFRAGRWAVIKWFEAVRAVSPQVATDQVDGLLAALAARGRELRQERAEVLGRAIQGGVQAAVTSEPVREVMLASMDAMLDEMMPTVMPRMFDAMRDEENVAVLDEMMAGLLVRQLPGAMEKVAPILLMRTAAKPTQLVPNLLSGVLPRG